MSEAAVKPLNPALAQAISMPPALVEAIEDDPELLVKLTRGQLAIVQDRLVKRALTDSEITLSQLAIVHEALAKQANLKGTQAQVGAGPGGQVVINFFVGDKKEAFVIEGQGQVTDVTPG